MSLKDNIKPSSYYHKNSASNGHHSGSGKLKKKCNSINDKFLANGNSELQTSNNNLGKLKKINIDSHGVKDVLRILSDLPKLPNLSRSESNLMSGQQRKKSNKNQRLRPETQSLYQRRKNSSQLGRSVSKSETNVAAEQPGLLMNLLNRNKTTNNLSPADQIPGPSYISSKSRIGPFFPYGRPRRRWDSFGSFEFDNNSPSKIDIPVTFNSSSSRFSADSFEVSPAHRFPKLDREQSQDDPVEVREIDLKIPDNAAVHHTSEFECVGRVQNPHLVLRRGQHFDIEVTFARQVELSTDLIEVVWEIGEYPKESDGTRLVLPLRTDAPLDESMEGCVWWTELVRSFDRSASLRIHIGSNSIVGNWTMKLVSTVRPKPMNDLIEEAKASMKAIEYVYTINGIYILFNPWSPTDQVYIPGNAERQEYVMNDVGKIWRGSYNMLKPTSWVYGQFEHVVLDACMLILEKSQLPFSMRSSPIQVTRTIAAIVNSPDDDGVLEGNWTGEYRGGVQPTDWTGSTDILRQYAASGRPVKYGQCWVFAGIVTTVCRCLGIPCRVVTNYSSAHDTNTSVTVDYHVDVEGRPLKHLNMDSVWNFHVWNDVWMTRPDLPKGYGGWQAIDSTPQEKSDGLFRCGPAPLEAVRNGEVGLGFDTAFVFSEVNADKCYWLHVGRGTKFVDKETDKIGRMMLTKKPGVKLGAFNNDKQEITEEYKFTEGSKAERMAVMTALFTGGSHSIMAYREAESKVNDVNFKLDLQDAIMIGQDLHVTFRMNNTVDYARTVHVSLRVDSAMYMGTNLKKIKAERMVVMLQPGGKAVAQMTILVRDYLHRLMDQSSFVVTALAQVKETGQLYTANDDFRVQKPDIKITPVQPLKVGQVSKVHLEFDNPIPLQLTGCKFIMDGPGLTDPREIICKSVMPHAPAKVTTEIRPWKSGEMALTAHFSSSQLSDVDGYTTVMVKE